jgi:hypothetical protein
MAACSCQPADFGVVGDDTVDDAVKMQNYTDHLIAQSVGPLRAAFLEIEVTDCKGESDDR